MGFERGLFPQADNISDEVIRRAYTNRCYYAVYHRLLDTIENNFPKYKVKGKNRTFGNTGTHDQICYVFDDISKSTNSKIAKRLEYKFRDFLSKRHKADYMLDEDFDEHDFKSVLKHAEDIPNLLETLENE